MIRISLFVLSLLFLLASANGQEPLECLFSRGEVWLEVGGRTYPLKHGDRVKKGNVVLAEGASAILKDAEGNHIRLNGPDKKSFRQCHELCSGESPFKAYLSYVTRMILQSDDEEEFAIRGAVSRGRPFLMESPLPTEMVFGREVGFQWTAEADGSFYFHLFDAEKVLLLKMAILGDQLQMFLPAALLQPGQTYFWSVTNDRDEFPAVLSSFTLASPEEAAEFGRREQAILSQADPHDPLDALLISEFYKAQKAFSRCPAYLHTVTDQPWLELPALKLKKELLELPTESYY